MYRVLCTTVPEEIDFRDLQAAILWLAASRVIVTQITRPDWLDSRVSLGFSWGLVLQNACDQREIHTGGGDPSSARLACSIARIFAQMCCSSEACVHGDGESFETSTLRAG